MITPTLVNRHKNPYFDIYIGRGTIWGNPYVIDGENITSRAQSIEMYSEYLDEMYSTGKITKDDFASLSGKILACSCVPLDCHGNVIIRKFNKIFGIEPTEESLFDWGY